MKAAASYVGGRNVACVWSQCDMEKGAQQTGTDGSVIAKRFRSEAEKEKQVEVSLQSKAAKPITG